MLVGGLNIAQTAIKRVPGVNGRPADSLVEELNRLSSCGAGVNHREPRAGPLLERGAISCHHRVPQIAKGLEDKTTRGTYQCLRLCDRTLSEGLVAQRRLVCRRGFERHRLLFRQRDELLDRAAGDSEGYCGKLVQQQIGQPVQGTVSLNGRRRQIERPLLGDESILYA